MHASCIFRLPSSILSTVCTQDPEQHVLDGWQDSMELPPSTQFKLSYKTTQQMKSRTRQSNGWQTSRPIPRHGHILLHWVFQRLKVRIEERFLPCLFLFDPFHYLCSGESPCLRPCLAGTGENLPHGSHHCLRTSPACLSVLWTTKQSPLLTAIHDLAFVHHQRMLFRPFWIVLCLFLFPFLFFFSPGGPCLVWTLSVVPCPKA